MTWRIWMEFIIVLVLSNFTTWAISWYLGRRNGEKWEKYRTETKENSQKNIPYGDRFRQDLGLDERDWQPNFRHTKRKINGHWTEQ
jgi:hypothetical protein